MIAAHRIPRIQPLRFEEADDVETAYRCACGTCISLTRREPLPDGWRVVMRHGSAVAYVCGACVLPVPLYPEKALGAERPVKGRP